MKDTKTLIVIVGPTAVGKTALCVDIAKRLGTQVVSADSRQFYKEMNIGTAKPTAKEMDDIPHHLVNNLSIEEPYDVGKYEKDALQIIQRLFKNNDHVILAGGSGLYVNAICKGLDEMPAIPNELRNELNNWYAEEGLLPLQTKLKSLDPKYYELVDLNNPQRIIRALEVCIASGKTYSSFRKSQAINRPFNIIKIGLQREREELYSRIDQRMDEMIADGLFEEVELLLPHQSKNALQTVGYKEIFEFMRGSYDKPEAVRLLKRNSRRYAKRQFTWFRKDDNITWFHPNEVENILKYIRQKTS